MGSISNGRGSVGGSESGAKTGAPKSRGEHDSEVDTEKTQVGNVGTFDGIDGDIPF